jgi:hypothetical protein
MSLTKLLAGRTSETAKKSTGIILTDPALLADARAWIEADQEMEAAESKRTAVEMNFKPAVRRAWFAANAGRPKPESSVKLVTPLGQLSVSFAAQWFPKAELSTIGIPKPMLRKKCSLKVNVDLIPAESQEAVVEAILAALTAHGCEAALDAKLSDYPTEAFASSRHVDFTPDQNESFELAGLATRCALRR